MHTCMLAPLKQIALRRCAKREMPYSVKLPAASQSYLVSGHILRMSASLFARQFPLSE